MLDEAEGIERRLFERTPCFWHGNFKGDEEKPGYAIFQNFSALGAEFKTYSPLDIGQQLDFNVITNRMVNLSFSGRVRWHRRSGKFSHVGITFSKPMFVPLKRIM